MVQIPVFYLIAMQPWKMHSFLGILWPLAAPLHAAFFPLCVAVSLCPNNPLLVWTPDVGIGALLKLARPHFSELYQNKVIFRDSE